MREKGERGRKREERRKTRRKRGLVGKEQESSVLVDA